MNCPIRNYKFRLYPTKKMEDKLEQTLDGCRWVYNYFIARNLSLYDMQFALTELKEQEPWLYNYHSKMLQMVVHKVDAARKSLSALKTNGHKVGRLHYAGHEEYNTFTYNQSGFRIENDRLYLSKIGSIKIALHRQPINIKQVMLSKQAEKWYAIVACETTTPIFKFIDLRKSVGIDVGIAKFAHDSDDHKIENPLFLKKMLRPLRRAQRKVSRRIKGSNNHTKASSWVKRLHERIANKRRDFLHKLSNGYANRYDIIFLERLRILNMVKNHRLAGHIQDSGWRAFKIMLQYKAKIIVEVEPAYTSINCSRCNSPVPKELAIRTHRCDKCGLVIDRDQNAALNIKQKGLMMLPKELGKVTPTEIALQSMKWEATYSVRQLTNSSHWITRQ